MSLFRKLTQPPFPNVAVGIAAEGASVVALERRRKGFRLSVAGHVQFPLDLITPSFEDANITAPGEAADIIRDLALKTGLGRQTAWSVALPEEATRSTIITMEGAPASGSETEEMLRWKMERAFHHPLDELRVSRRRLSIDERGRGRYLATGMRLSVLAEYEDVFRRLGWQAGLILPRHMGEAAWLMRGARVGDALLVSSHEDGFTAMLLRESEPFVIRKVACDPASATDELYRLLLFYRERLATNFTDSAAAAESEADAAYDEAQAAPRADEYPSRTIERVLLVGDGLDEATAYAVISETLGIAPILLRPEDFSLSMPASELRFDHIAAPAGLAALN